jgi:hypothetical protein
MPFDREAGQSSSGRDPGKFFKGLFHGGLIPVHEMLGAAETLEAIEEIGQGIGDDKEFIKRHVLVVFEHFGQAADLDAGKGNLIQKFALDILVQAEGFGGSEIFGIKPVAQGIGIAGLAAAEASGGGSGVESDSGIGKSDDRIVR